MKETETQKAITVDDLQNQVRDHIRSHDLFDWHEALTEEEMIYLENLMLTFAPMFSPGSIGFAKTVQPYLDIAGRSKSLEEKEKEISDLREDLAEQTKVIRKQLEVIDNLGNEAKRLKELIREWWLIANRIKPQEAEQILGAKEYIDYMRSVEAMYNKFKSGNNL